MTRSVRLQDLATHVGGRLEGPPDATVERLGALDSAGPDALSHLSSPAYRGELPGARAGVVLLREADLPACPVPAIVVTDPYLAYARCSALFVPERVAPAAVHAAAVVDATARLGEGVDVGALAVVGAHARVGAGSCIGAGATLADGVVVGAECRIGSGVRLHRGTVVGDRVRISAGAVIGAAGFGFTPDERGRWTRIEQLGGVRIGDDVDIGANTTIDCGAIEDTVIGAGVKIDNQVQIGHNCRIGEHTLICGCTGIVGSTRIGRHCVLAGGVGVGGDGPISICDGVIVSGMTHVSRSIEAPGTYSGGVLHGPTRSWKRNALRLSRLDETLRALSRRLARLDGGEGD